MENPKTVMVSALKLPKDVMYGEVLISFIGRQSVLIENYRSILFFSDMEIKLQAKTCKVIITGKRLAIEYYTSEEMKIVGQIKSVAFDS